jgi:DNA-binding winged helix-turn-helix (wHTH) protein/TolB-like protein
VERPFQAYEGDKPYVFACYAHDDKAEVYPELVRLRNSGVNLWYDEGIAPGSEWSDTLASHIERCAVFLYFVTPRSVVSEHCRREVNFALEQSCGILAVHLERTELPSGLQLTLSNRQAILKFDEPPAVYEAKLARAIRDAAHRDIEESSATRLSLGDWTLDVATLQLTRATETHLLDPKALSVLLHLIDRAPQVVSRAGLIDRTWPNVVVGENVLDQAITQLRRALGDDARQPEYIETLPKKGYRLIAPLRYATDRASIGGVAETGGERDGSTVQSANGRRRQLRHLGIAAATAAVVLVGVASWLVGMWGTHTPQPWSIGVLPLVEVGSDPAVATYAQAMTEELRTALARYRELQTVSALDATSTDATTDARYAVSGNVQRFGEHIRLRVSLTRTHDSRMVWSETFDRQWSDTLADPERTATTIAQFVRLQVNSQIQCAHTRQVSRRSDAADALCAAYAELYRFVLYGDGDPRVTLGHAERAVALDPGIVDAHRLVAQMYAMLGENGYLTWQDAAGKSHAALNRAFDLAPEDPGLLMTLADVQTLELNYKAAEETYRAVLANPLFPPSPDVHLQLGHLAMARGNLTEALDHYRRALRVFDASGLLYMFNAAALWCDGQNRKAIEMANAGLRVLEVGVNRYHLLTIKAYAHEALGDLASARTAFEQALEAVEPARKSATILPLVRLGRVEEARARLARLEAMDDPPVQDMVYAYMVLEDPRAFEWLHTAIDRHIGPIVPFIRVLPLYSELRKDRHWNEVLAHLDSELGRQHGSD